MGERQDPRSNGNADPSEAAEEPGLVDRARSLAATETARARSAGKRHVSVAVPFRAFERNRSLAASVLAGGVAYRLFLWVSLELPHGTASWKALLPGAFLVAVGFQVTHGLVVYLLGPKLEKSASLYGDLGVVATMLFFMWVVGRIVVTAPILNSALHDELRGRGGDAGEATIFPAAPGA